MQAFSFPQWRDSGATALMARMVIERVIDGTSTADVAARLVLTRLALGLKPSQLAKIVGLTQQMISNYEAGRHLISVTSSNRYVSAFGLTLDWIYRGDMKGLSHDLIMRIQIRVKMPQGRKRA